MKRALRQLFSSKIHVAKLAKQTADMKARRLDCLLEVP